MVFFCTYIRRLSESKYTKFLYADFYNDVTKETKDSKERKRKQRLYSDYFGWWTIFDNMLEGGQFKLDHLSPVQSLMKADAETVLKFYLIRNLKL